MSADLPLAGRRVVVTRAEDQADALADALRRLGAEPVLVPAIRSAPTDDPEALRMAARALDGARWVGMTSPSGVRHGWCAVEAAWPDGLPDSVGVAVLGPGTGAALRARGVVPTFAPAEASGDAFAAELPLKPGDRVTLFRSDLAREAIAATLRQRGAALTDAVAYRTIPEADPAIVERALDAGPDAVTFTSPSTVRGFLAGLEDRSRLRGVALVPIGPVTAEALAAAGLDAAVVPAAHTIPGLLDALVALLR